MAILTTRAMRRFTDEPVADAADRSPLFARRWRMIADLSPQFADSVIDSASARERWQRGR